LSVTNSGTGSGVYGVSAGASGYGVFGNVSGENASGVTGYGTGTNSRGIYGIATGSSGYGVYGTVISTGGYGGYFSNSGGSGTDRGVAVAGLSGSGSSADTHPIGTSYFRAGGEFAGPNGVIGAASSDSTVGRGVLGVARSGDGSVGIYGYKPDGGDYAGFFYGNVHVTGNLSTNPKTRYCSVHGTAFTPQSHTYT